MPPCAVHAGMSGSALGAPSMVDGISKGMHGTVSFCEQVPVAGRSSSDGHNPVCGVAARERAKESCVTECEDPAVGRGEQIAACSGRCRHRNNRSVQVNPAGRAEESSIAVTEHASV